MARRKINRKRNIRKFVVAGVLSIAGISAFLHKSFDSVDFLEAKNNFKLRQEYLDETIKEEYGYAEGLKKIDYVHSTLSIKRGGFSTLISTYVNVPANYRGSTLETRVEVYRRAFDGLKNEDEFLSMLIDHEYRHTDLFRGRVKLHLPLNSAEEKEFVEKEIRERIFDINGDLWRIYAELYAYSSQISQFPKRKITNEFRKEMTEMYNSYVDSLYSKEETPLILALRKTFVKN
ncbi:hypothetical protein HYT56_05360 [Candidatus Woesearchaeota archaeon]|nr:hypothetical protein [Candidatus Woesearchaeota archaeon]